MGFAIAIVAIAVLLFVLASRDYRKMERGDAALPSAGFIAAHDHLGHGAASESFFAGPASHSAMDHHHLGDSGTY